jgi:hypothetical protein
MDHCGEPELKKNAENRKEKMQSMAYLPEQNSLVTGGATTGTWRAWRRGG